MNLSIFDFYTAGFIMTASTGHPPISLAILSLVYFALGIIGSQNYYLLFGSFSAAVVCATCFKELHRKRPSPVKWQLVLYSLCVSLIVSLVPAYVVTNNEHPLMMGFILLFEITLYEDVGMWIAKVSSTTFLWICVYLTKGQVHERNVFILAALVIVYAMMLYSPKDASKPDTPKSEPTKATQDTH